MAYLNENQNIFANKSFFYFVSYLPQIEPVVYVVTGEHLIGLPQASLQLLPVELRPGVARYRLEDGGQLGLQGSQGDRGVGRRRNVTRDNCRYLPGKNLF